MTNITIEDILLERLHIKEECNLNTEKDINNYVTIYNIYNQLLLSYMMKDYYLKNVDDELDKHKDIFNPLNSDDKDLYQKSSEGLLKYFYKKQYIYRKINR